MKNDFAIVDEKKKDGKLFLLVNTSKATLRGMNWNELGEWGKRKFENLLFLTRMHATKDKLKIIYVSAIA